MMHFRNSTRNYLILGQCSQVMVFVSFFIVSQQISGAVVTSLEPSPSITNRDQLQTSMFSSFSMSSLYLKSEVYDSDERDEYLSTPILKIHSSALELTSIALSPDLLSTVQLQTGDTSDVKLSLQMQETSSLLMQGVATHSSVPLSTKIYQSVSLTSPSADRLEQLSLAASESLSLFNLPPFSESPLSLAATMSDVLGQPSSVFSSIKQQSYAETINPHSTLEMTIFSTSQLEPTESVAETMVHETLISNQEYTKIPNTEKINTDIFSSADINIATLEVTLNDVVKLSSSSLQLKPSNELTTDFPEFGETTTDFNQELLNTVISTGSMKVMDSSDAMTFISFEDELPASTVGIIQPTTPFEFEVSTDIYTEMMYSSLMSSRLGSLDVMSATSEMLLSEAFDDTLERSTLKLLQTQVLQSSEGEDDFMTHVELSMDYTANTMNVELSSFTISELSSASYSTNEYSISLTFGNGGSSRAVYSQESIFEMTRTLEEPVSSSEFLTPSMISVATQFSQSIETSYVMQESLTSKEPEPVIMCFTTVMTLPNSVATLQQPSDTSYAPPDMTSWSVKMKNSVQESLYEIPTQSWSLRSHQYSTEIYSSEQALNSEMTDFRISSQPMLSTINNNFATKLFSNPTEVGDSLTNSIFQSSNWKTSVFSENSTLQLFDFSHFPSSVASTSVIREGIEITTNTAADLSIFTFIQPNASISVESTLSSSLILPETVDKSDLSNVQTSASIPHESLSYQTLSDVIYTSDFDNLNIYSTVNGVFKDETAIETESRIITLSVLTNSQEAHNIRKRAALELEFSSPQTNTEQFQNQLMSNTMAPSVSSSVLSNIFIQDITQLVKSSEIDLFSTSGAIQPSEISDVPLSFDTSFSFSLYGSQATSTVTGSFQSSDEISNTPSLLYSSFGNINVLGSLYSYIETTVLELIQSSFETSTESQLMWFLSDTNILSSQILNTGQDFVTSTLSGVTNVSDISLDSSFETTVLDLPQSPSETQYFTEPQFMLFPSDISILSSQIFITGQDFVTSTSSGVTSESDISFDHFQNTTTDPFLAATEFEVISIITMLSVDPTANVELDEYSVYSTTILEPTGVDTPPSVMIRNSSVLSEASNLSDGYATNMTFIASTVTSFTSTNIQAVFSSSSSSMLQISSIGDDYASLMTVASTSVNFTGTTTQPTISEMPSMNSTSLLEISSTNNYSTLMSMTSIPLNVLTTSQYQEETFTYISCTTIYPSAMLETLTPTVTISQVSESTSSRYFSTQVSDIPDFVTSYMTSTLEEDDFETITLEPSTFETVLSTIMISESDYSVASLSEVNTPSQDFASLEISSSVTQLFSMSTSPMSELIENTEAETTPLDSTYVFTVSESHLPSSLDVQSSLEELSYSLEYTSNIPKISEVPPVLTISPTPSSAPEQSKTTSMYSSIHPSSPVTTPTSTKPPVDVITTGTTKEPYVSLDTSFVTQPSWLELEINVPTSVDTKSIEFILDIEGRLASAYIQARAKVQGSSRRRRAVAVDEITVQHIDISRTDSNSEALSVVYYIVEGGERIPAAESAATMQQLSTEALSIVLGYPVATQVTVYGQSSSPASKIWIAAVVLGVLAFIFLTFCCFCWCCRPKSRDGNFDPETLKFLQFKQKYPYHSYAASKRRWAASSPAALDHSQGQFIEDERSVKTSDYHTDDDDSVRVKDKRRLPAPPRIPSRSKTPISRQDDAISESDSFVSTTEDELKMSSSVSSQRQQTSKMSKHEQSRQPKEGMFSHVTEQQAMKHTPKKLQKRKEQVIKQKNEEAEWRQAQAEISAILEPEVVKSQAVTTFVAPHKRKRKSKDKRPKHKLSHASSSVEDDTELEEDGMYSSLPDVHYARPSAAQNENGDIEMSSLGQTRKRMHALLDEAFSLVNLPPTGRNAVRPLQSTAENSSMMDYKKASKARERRRQQMSSTDAYTGSDTDDSVFRSRHPFLRRQQTAPVGHEMRDGFSQTKEGPGKVVIVPVTQLSEDTGGVIWSIYDAEDQMARLSPTKEPASMPGGLDPSPPVTIKSPSGALMTLPPLSTLPESELISRGGPAVPLKLFEKTKAPGNYEAQTSFQQGYPSRSYLAKETLPDGSIQQRVPTTGKWPVTKAPGNYEAETSFQQSYLSRSYLDEERWSDGSIQQKVPTMSKRPATDMLSTLEKEKRIGKPVDDSFDELNVTAIIKGAKTPQPVMRVIKEELERLAKLRPQVSEDKL
ncbi:mucin-17-like [Anneissia japonica]|uniref:mucin-17-like n=1 Tax=Anneissia japonica TaxID=1529436 RepID=UPI001425B624|nr:mucin-17-like [Anneissia japonica]